MNSCGYCGFPLNNLEHLECMVCGHTPWTQYIPYPIYSNTQENLAELCATTNYYDTIRDRAPEDE